MPYLSAGPAGSTISQDAGTTTVSGALVFSSRERAFQVLVAEGFDASLQIDPQDETPKPFQPARYASAGVALRHVATADSWVLAYPRQRIGVLSRDALLVLPERQLILLRGDEVNAGSFQDFKGVLLVLRDTSLSPHDRKLLARQPQNANFSNGWGRLLGAYLETLDAATLCFVGREESGGALIEQQITALLRRALLEQVNGMRWSRRESADNRAKSRGELLFKNICAWVADNFAMPEMTSELVANHFHVSPRYIQNLFSKYGDGTTFVSFLREKRLRHAWDMLVGAQYAHQNISEICWTCGFSDPVYFGKIFRDFFGMTPGQARRQAFTAKP